MTRPLSTLAALLLASAGVGWHTGAAASPSPDQLALAYSHTVRQQVHPPAAEVQAYAIQATALLQEAGIVLSEPQYVAVADRNPHVQAILVLWMGPGTAPRLIGASPISSGRVGRFDHFQTPTGVFDHTVAGGDFRAEGTKNEYGIRGYGAKGMRIYDFGWQQAVRGWGRGGMGTMRLQMHATDPDALESRLGSAQSKGCLRIPATLNRFLDHYGVLDADYEAAAREGERMWVLPSDRVPVTGAGRYLVILDSARARRPAWALSSS